MKICHICEQDVKFESGLFCCQCSKTYCNKCLQIFFGLKNTDIISLRVQLPISLNQKYDQKQSNSNKWFCYSCRHQCQCRNCMGIGFLFYEGITQRRNLSQLNNKQQYCSKILDQNQLPPQKGLFAGKNLHKLPFYMQNLYRRKKLLYAKSMNIPNKRQIKPELQVTNIQKLINQALQQHKEEESVSLEIIID